MHPPQPNVDVLLDKRGSVGCSSTSKELLFITCSNCFMQYVEETAQQLDIRFATHRASMSGKLKLIFCKWLAEHVSTGICKNCKYVSILYK